MTLLLIVLVAIHLAGLMIILFAAMRAPYGYEDEKGFHKTDSAVSTPSHPAP